MLHSQLIVILVITAVDLTRSLSQDGGRYVIHTESTAIPSLSCMTGKRVAGMCVKRERCDYGTSAIDFSLYRPRGYKPTCSPEDVCCPPQYIIQLDDRVLVPENEGFDFDDDD